MREPNTLQIQMMPLSPYDQDRIAALQRTLEQFWSRAAVQAAPRVGYDAFMALTPPLPGVTMHPSTDPAVPGWVCVPEHAVDDHALLYIHGGAYVMGSASAYRGFVSQIAARTRRATYILEYPLAPETALPGALNVATAALTRLGERFAKVGVVGDSAGGGLTLATLGNTDVAAVA